MVKTSMARAERSMLRETADRPYFFRKVIRKPKPRKIITWTSWNTDTRRVVISRNTIGIPLNINSSCLI